MYIYGLTASERANVYFIESGTFSRDTSFRFAKGKFEAACAEYTNVNTFEIENKEQTEIIAEPESYDLIPLD